MKAGVRPSCVHWRIDYFIDEIGENGNGRKGGCYGLMVKPQSLVGSKKHMRMFEIRRTIVAFVFLYLQFPALNGQASHYGPSLDSLNRHPLPQWYSDAKLGFFVHWGFHSVPGWAPLV